MGFEMASKFFHTQVFVFAAMMEYAVVNVMLQKEKTTGDGKVGNKSEVWTIIFIQSNLPNKTQSFRTSPHIKTNLKCRLSQDCIYL